ncbi:MAG: DUF188 domain-containing protein [Spirochaetales bacterium]|nr:DUF188 domain-containing protein [Spirochaetales bacterium]
MKIWIDGDSCPRQVREIVNKRCIKEQVHLFYVANRTLPLPESEFIHFVQTSPEADSADDYIEEHCVKGDLVITRDIPLASRMVETERAVINDRGTAYTKNNIRERLQQRDFMQMMREAGIEQEKGSNYGARELRSFSSCFDRTLVQMLAEERFRKARGL